jgi:PqqD family protein of HPr-rel-A system
MKGISGVVSMIDDTTVAYRRFHGFEYNEVPDGYVIYDHESGQVHFLNPTAAAIFELCDGQHDAAAMTDVIQDAFDLPQSPGADVRECLASLVEQGLVEACSQVAPSVDAAF